MHRRTVIIIRRGLHGNILITPFPPPANVAVSQTRRFDPLPAASGLPRHGHQRTGPFGPVGAGERHQADEITPQISAPETFPLDWCAAMH
jgi:hypothetical protein